MDTVKEFKDHLRMSDLAYDPWGTSIAAFFDVAAEMYNRDMDIPVDWHYCPSQLGVNVEDDILADLFSRCETEDIRYIGDLLHRYTNMLKIAGKDY